MQKSRLYEAPSLRLLRTATTRRKAAKLATRLNQTLPINIISIPSSILFFSVSVYLYRKSIRLSVASFAYPSCQATRPASPARRQFFAFRCRSVLPDPRSLKFPTPLQALLFSANESADVHALSMHHPANANACLS